MTEVSWDDVARFVGQHMSTGLRGTDDFGGDLLSKLAQAYIESRGLPESALPTVIQMVDSVL